MCGLAIGIACADHKFCKGTTLQEVDCIVVTANNQAAVGSILNLTDHPGQRFSKMFCAHANRLLMDYPHLTIKVAWICRHNSNQGNKVVHALAKLGAAEPLCIEGLSLSWLHKHSWGRVQRHWQWEWPSRKQAMGLSMAVGNQLPSQRITWEMEGVMKANRQVGTRTMQVLTGHAFLGKFYNCQIPDEQINCKCGEELQTRQHILQVLQSSRSRASFGLPSTSLTSGTTPATPSAAPIGPSNRGPAYGLLSGPPTLYTHQPSSQQPALVTQ
jgi:hypothetical protein